MPACLHARIPACIHAFIDIVLCVYVCMYVRMYVRMCAYIYIICVITVFILALFSEANTNFPYTLKVMHLICFSCLHRPPAASSNAFGGLGLG